MNSSETIECRGERFIKTSWNEISVLKHEATGYYKASKACEDNSKRFEHWLQNKSTREYLEAASIEYEIPIETDVSRNSGLPLLYRLGAQFTNELRGYYIHPDLFHDVCYWANKSYALKVSRLMNLLNERNQLINQTLEQTIENLNKEITDLKAHHQQDINRLDSMQSELISRAETIDEQETVIEMQNETIREYNQPFNQEISKPMIYALSANNNEFQLRYDANPNKPQGIRSVSMINAEYVRNESLKILEMEGLVIHRNRKRLISKTNIDYVFNLIEEVRTNSRVSQNTIDERNEFIDKQLARYRSMRQTSLVEGYIYEYETIRARPELTPWKLVPKAILNAKGENRKDKGIDAVELTNEGEFLSIVQIKHHHGDYLRRDELQTFFNKCSQERYKDIRKRLFVHNCKISDKLRNLIHSYNIEIEILN